jgi:hypothetical protein
MGLLDSISADCRGSFLRGAGAALDAPAPVAARVSPLRHLGNTVNFPRLPSIDSLEKNRLGI